MFSLTWTTPYFRAQHRGSVRGRLAMTASLGLLTLVTASGIFAASMMMWLPQLQAA